MSFNPNPGRKEYTAGVSQTVFTFDFKIFVDTDIKVYQTPLNATPDDTNDLLTLTTDYTVSINGDLGGTITLVSASTLGDSITLKRELPITRLTEYQTSGDLLATTLNQDQDYQTYLTGDKQTDIDRALKFEDSVQNVSAVIPSPEALKVLGWNSGETALENFTIGDDSVFVNIYNADSIADLLLVDTTIYSTVNVRGYYTPNDGGGGIFNYDATQSGINNGVTILNGWVRQNQDTITAEMAGAKGDGTTNDAAAINAGLLVSDIDLTAGKTYLITGTLTLNGNDLNGNYATLLCSSSNKIMDITDACVNELVIDGDGYDHTSYVVEFNDGNNPALKDVVIKNIHGQTSTNTYCVRIPAWNCYDFLLDNVSFIDISQDDHDGVTSGSGFVGGIIINDDVAGTDTTTSRGIFRNIYGNNIYTVDAGVGVTQDSDLIRGYTGNIVDDITGMNWNILYENIVAVNVGKRVFKTGSINGCTINGLKCYKNDGLGDMYTVIGLTTNTSRWTISNVTAEGTFLRGIEISGDDHIISNVKLKSLSTGGSGLQLGTPANGSQRTRVNNCNLDGFGQGIFFYDSYQCEVSDAHVDCAIGAVTNNIVLESLNTISNITFNNRGIVIDSGSTLKINNCEIVNCNDAYYPFDIRDGNVIVRGLRIEANIARRLMNLELGATQYADLDDIVIIRNDVLNLVNDDHSMFTTKDSTIGAYLRIGRMQTVANANPNGTTATAEGRPQVLLKNVRYDIEDLEHINNAAIGSVNNDLRTVAAQGKCRIGSYRQIQDVATAVLSLSSSTGATFISLLELDNASVSAIQAHVGTQVLRGGATTTGVLNTPVTITI